MVTENSGQVKGEMRRAVDPVLGMREGGMPGGRPLFYVWVVVMPVPEVKKVGGGQA